MPWHLYGMSTNRRVAIRKDGIYTMKNTKKLAMSAMLIALSAVLALISMAVPLQLPFGGSVTLASMLPIVLVGYMFGIKWGLGSAIVFAFIQMFLGWGTVSAFFLPGDSQMMWWKAVIVVLIDYILAYTVLGFSGIFTKKIKKPALALCVGSIFALTLRYICHIISGAIFFGTWAEWFFTDVMPGLGEWALSSFSGGGLALIYSVVYNGLYMIPEIILTAVLALIVPNLMGKYVKRYE